MANYYPPTGFHFSIDFDGIEGESNGFNFQSVSGLSSEMEYEEVKEGGLNHYSHQLPVKAKYTDLVLKRGMLKGSKLVAWVEDAIENFNFKPVNMQVKLLNEDHEPLKTWSVVHVLPKKLEVSNFDAEKSELVIESLTVSYNYFKIIS